MPTSAALARRRFAWALLGAIALSSPACGGEGRGASDDSVSPIRVAASVPPAAWLVERVGGERVEVAELLPPGRSPHTWEPAPKELLALDRARLVVAVDHPSFPFERRLLAAARRGGAEVVTMAGGGVPLTPIEAQGAATDPHVWLDPMVMAAIARDVAESLARLDPAHAGEYRGRRDETFAEIDALDREVRDTLAAAPGRRFLVHHPAWGWFAARYGLTQDALETDGKEPSPRQLAAWVDDARRRGVAVVLAERRSSGRAARVLAEEVGARVVVLDPLARDWPEAMRRTAKAVAEAAVTDRAAGASGS